ncbi:MAG: hypothetical protein ABFD69_07775 [Candidatus Sumerlaeia bacterium]
MDRENILRRVRFWLILFVIGLVLSGVTAFPLRWEVGLLDGFLQPGSLPRRLWPALADWIGRVDLALNQTETHYPFLFYGTDWLAFAHLVIAVAFWGPLRDPVKNIWVIQFGMIACVMVIPLALIAGPIRGIPFWWRLIDCSFGVIGIVPLWLACRDTKTLVRLTTNQTKLALVEK